MTQTPPQVRRDLIVKRKILNADELVSMKNLRPRLEGEFPNLKQFMFSIDGTLNGTSIKGALFAGECILVRAQNFKDALKLAKEGLASTVELIFESYDDKPVTNVLADVNIETRERAGLPLTPHQTELMRRVLADKSKK